MPDLERKLEEFRTYYNQGRGRSSLNGNTPYTLASGQAIEDAKLGAVHWCPDCLGLVQLPKA